MRRYYSTLRKYVLHSYRLIWHDQHVGKPMHFTLNNKPVSSAFIYITYILHCISPKTVPKAFFFSSILKCCSLVFPRYKSLSPRETWSREPNVFPLSPLMLFLLVSKSPFYRSEFIDRNGVSIVLWCIAAITGVGVRLSPERNYSSV